MAKKLTEDLEKGKTLLKDMTLESGYLYDALTSIGASIQTAIENALEGGEKMGNVGQKIATTYKKDLVNSIKESARSMDKLVGLQLKINSGQNASKEINNALLKNQAKQEVLNSRINMLRKTGVKISKKQQADLIEILTLEKAALDALDEQNTEKQKGISITGVLSKSMGGMLDKLDKSGTLSGLLKGNLKDTLTPARAAELSIASMATFLINAIVELDKIQTHLSRQMGFSIEQGAKIQERFENIASSSGHTLLNYRDIHKTTNAITSVTGVWAGTLRKDVVEGASIALQFMQLSADAVARLAVNAQVTGQHFNDQLLSMAQGVIEAENMAGVTLDAKKVFEESAGLTGVIRANLGRNYEIITKTVGQAQALGLTMQDLAGISSNLLNFQSSIEAELTAELFLGKQLNLEKARLYALTGDYGNLQKEIMKNVGSEYDFLNMNVLAKEKYAAALGMSVNQMSNLVMKNADLKAIEEEAARRGDKEMVKEMQRLTMQDTFNKLIEKLQTKFIEMMNPDGALTKLGNLFVGLMDNAGLLYTTMGAIIGLKFGALILQLIALSAASKSATISGIAAKFAMNPIAGLAVLAALGGVIALATGTMDSADTKIPKYAKGGVFNKESVGIIGEAGPEAVVPLGEFYNRIDKITKTNESDKPSQFTSMAIVEDTLDKILTATTHNKPYRPLAGWETRTKYS
jgi:hypothetical protein